MKFKLYKNSAAPLIIPNAALALAELSGGDSITAHVAESAIVLLPEKLNAAEAIAAIGALSELTEGLMLALSDACEEYECTERQEECECKSCGHPECRGIELPPCLMDEAGFPKDSGYEAFVVDGKIVITPATVLDENFTEDLPEVLRSFVEKNELDIGVLRTLVESESEVVYGG